MTVPTKTPQTPSPETIEDIITRGDLSKLNATQRTEYYIKVCNRHGLDYLTQPFDWLWLNGKLVLYANRRCADQLRKNNSIGISIVSQEYTDALLIIHVKAKDSTGREDEDLGAVSFPEQLRGEARANAILKCVTKAKRRVTLSISGLGYLDETEVEDIPDTAKIAPPESKPTIQPPSKAAEALIEITDKITTTSGETVNPLSTGSIDTLVNPPEMTGQAWRRFGEQMVKLARSGQEFTPEQQAQMSQMKVARPKMWETMATAVYDAQKSRPKETKEPEEPKEPEAPPQPVPHDDPDAYRVWFIDQLSKCEKRKDVDDLFHIQRPLWEKCFPPDIEDWEALFSERSSEVS